MRGFPIVPKRDCGNDDYRKQSIPKTVVMAAVCSTAATQSALLSLKSSGGTFGQESLFPL